MADPDRRLRLDAFCEDCGDAWSVVLGEQSVANVVHPLSLDERLALEAPLLAEAHLLQHALGRLVRRVRLRGDLVQADAVEAVFDREVGRFRRVAVPQNSGAIQ